MFYINDPSLMFMGIPLFIMPFNLMNQQARWVAHYLAGKPCAQLPSKEQMMI